MPNTSATGGYLVGVGNPAVLSDATDTDIAIVNAKQRYEKLIKQLPEAIQGQEGIFQALITEKEFGN